MDNKNPQNTAEPAVDNRFFTTLQVLRRGELISDLSAALREVTESAQLTGKPASVTLKLTLKPAAQIKGAVIIEDDVTVKLPKPQKENSIFYADDDGNLLREDPKQMKLGLRVIEAPAIAVQSVELRKVGAQ